MELLISPLPVAPSTMDFEPVIGLEIHAELLTQSKMFCGCAVVDSLSSLPNTSVCEICTGMPGSLPVVNERAIEYALRVALALHCTIHETSIFARKNYFYPDLPKGYQISQYERPLASDGWIDSESGDTTYRVAIRRVHLEEDTGKLFHRDDYSLIDYNRSGVPLLEIVSEPDMRSLDEVSAYVNAIRSLLRYLEVNSGDMHKGVIRFEANVSVRPVGTESLGTRTEIKNLNSFRALTRSIAFEIDRQSELLRRGELVRLETLGWDEERLVTISQRGKEEAHDYRYFPEPDLPPLNIERRWIDSIRSSLPELPAAKRARYLTELGITPYMADVLTADPDVARFFERCLEVNNVSPSSIAKWITGDLFGLINQAGVGIAASKVSPPNLVSLVALVEQGKINAASGKAVLAEMFENGEPASQIVESKGLSQVDNQAEIDRLVEKALHDHSEQVAEYHAGKKSILNWLLGQVMQAARGLANPHTVRERLEHALDDHDQHPDPER